MKERIQHGTKCFVFKSMEAFTILVLAGVINVSPPGVYTARAMLPTNLPEETDTHAAGSRKQLSQHTCHVSSCHLPSSKFFSRSFGRLQSRHGRNGLSALRHILRPLRTGWETFIDGLQSSQYPRIAVALPKAARLCHAKICCPIGSGHIKEDPLN